jgi:hypothetical protein
MLDFEKASQSPYRTQSRKPLDLACLSLCLEALYVLLIRYDLSYRLLVLTKGQADQTAQPI